MSILKLSPACKDYIWGGQNLISSYNKKNTNAGDILAETWELSTHKDGASTIENGEHKNKSLADYIKENGKEVLGTNCDKFEDFPILIKFIDAQDNLSIQVHPDNEYALKNENQFGKTEMWYVTDCKEGAFLYFGFNKEVSKDEFKQRIENNTLLEVLNKVNVKKGDVFFIEAGTIHAIGKDIIIAEIQQNSNVTYRVYDYGRTDKDGNTRELHVDKALQVTDTKPPKIQTSANHLAHCEYFTVDKLVVDNKYSNTVNSSSFVSILVLDGTGDINVGTEKLTYQKGDSFFIPAQNATYEITGNMEALVTTIS